MDFIEAAKFFKEGYSLKRRDWVDTVIYSYNEITKLAETDLGMIHLMEDDLKANDWLLRFG